MRVVSVVAVFVAAVAAGCSTQSVGEACEDVADRMCGRLVVCGALDYGDRADCVYAMVGGCCSGGECQDDVASPANVDRCVDELGDVSCATLNHWAANPSVVTAPMPAICRGVASAK